MKNKKSFVPLVAIVALVSCGIQSSLSGNPNAEVSENEVGGKEMGIPYVELINVFSKPEVAEAVAKAKEALSSLSEARRESYYYQLSGAYSELEQRDETTAMFYGSDKQYATMDYSMVETSKIGSAYSTKSAASIKGEYVLSKDRLTRLAKQIEKRSTGSETTNYFYLQQRGDYELTAYESLQSTFFSTFFGYATAGVTGTGSDGKLYQAYYSESSSTVTAYDKDGQSVKGFDRTYAQCLIDLNTADNPRYTAIYFSNVGETNVDRNGIREDKYHTTRKTSFTTSFTYNPLTENATAREAFLNNYPSVTLDKFSLYATDDFYGKQLLSVSKQANEPDTYKAYVTLMEGYDCTLGYEGQLVALNKETETLDFPQREEQLNLSKATIIDKSGENRVSQTSATTLKSTVKVRVLVTLKTSSIAPYLEVTEVEVP